MIDIHHHCLPGIDDGPRDWDTAVAMCRLAADEGIETIVATPHVLRGRWQNTDRGSLERLVSELNDRTENNPRVVLGSEYFFAHDMVEILRTNAGIIPLAESRYVLVEFAAHAVPPLVDQLFYRLQLDGWIPVIAHPERNIVFQARPEFLATLVRQGALVQITGASLTGGFGQAARKAAGRWLSAGMVHVLATDAHDVTRRPPRLREAHAAAVAIAGEETADALTRTNPAAIVANRQIPFLPEPDLATAEAGFLERMRRFWPGRNRDR